MIGFATILSAIPMFCFQRKLTSNRSEVLHQDDQQRYHPHNSIFKEMKRKCFSKIKFVLNSKLGQHMPFKDFNVSLLLNKERFQLGQYLSRILTQETVTFGRNIVAETV